MTGHGIPLTPGARQASSRGCYQYRFRQPSRHADEQSRPGPFSSPARHDTDGTALSSASPAGRRRPHAGPARGPAIPFDAEAARIYGRICAAVTSAGRKPRRRVADLMITAIAVAENVPLFTTNPDDFEGLDDLLTVVPATRPRAPHEG